MSKIHALSSNAHYINIHLRVLPKSRKQYNISNVKTELEIKNENGRITYLLGCVGLNWRCLYLKIWNKQICEYLKPWNKVVQVWKTLENAHSHEKMVTLNLPPSLSLLGATNEGFFFKILPCVFFKNSSTKKMSLSS